MWYSFYMNERMLLKEWRYYQLKGECNWLLKRTLMNDNTKTPEEKIKFYMENRRVRMEYSDKFKEQAQKVKEYMDDIHGCFDSEEEEEYYLDNKYINDDYEIMDYGCNQKLFNMYRRYNDLKEHGNDNVVKHLGYPTRKGWTLREHKFIHINKRDLKFIREVRKYNNFTVPQIEVLFGIIFFCRMNDTENANLNSEFKMKQFLGCFDNATMEDLEYVISHVNAVGYMEDGDIGYACFEDIGFEDEWIQIDVTKRNNKLDLTKMAHKYIPDISNKRYCEMCLRPFEPTNNRQKVCSECKPEVDAIMAKIRKVRQRFIEKNGKDACCGKCTDCTNPDCGNWWEYWFDEYNYRILEYKNKHDYPYPRYQYDIPKEEEEKIMKELLNNIKYSYTKEEKSEIVPWSKRIKSKRF